MKLLRLREWRVFLGFISSHIWDLRVLFGFLIPNVYFYRVYEAFKTKMER